MVLGLIGHKILNFNGCDMITEIILGVVLGGYALKEIARDNTVREKLKKWADEAGKKAKEYGEK